MSRIDEVQMLRVTDDSGSILICTCVPRVARAHVRMGSAEEWLSGKQVSCVAIDTNALVQIDDPAVLSAIGAWLGAAAVWLKTQKMRDDSDDDDSVWSDVTDPEEDQ